MVTTDHYSAAELARQCALKGIRHAVISPGSRSAPLVRAFHAQDGIECLTVIDERSAAFFAMGMAQQLGSAVALICTSGSAVLNHGPAVAEAFYQRIPLLVLSADRPVEWIDQQEGQAIRQRGVLAAHTNLSIELPQQAEDDQTRWYCTRMINQALDATLLPAPGPVHVNLPFREPLYGQAREAFTRGRTIIQVATEAFLPPMQAETLTRTIGNSERVMVLVGQGNGDAALHTGLRKLAALPQVAVLTEATSNQNDPAFLAAIDRLLGGIDANNKDELAPGLLITMGGAVVSKRIKTLLRQWRPAQHWHVDPVDRHMDTYMSLTHSLALRPEMFLAQVGQEAKANESGYADRWRALDEHTRQQHDRLLAAAPFCDLSVSRTILARIPQGSQVHLANSTAARYAQLFPGTRDLRFFSNRGTSGIDGCTSTALGACLVSRTPTTLITGDIAFCYDSNAFWNEHASPLLRVIVIDNGGGNIFRYIPGPDSDPELLPYFEAPHHRDPLALAQSYGLTCMEARDHDSLDRGLEELYKDHPGPAVLVVRTDGVLSAATLRDYFEGLRNTLPGRP